MISASVENNLPPDSKAVDPLLISPELIFQFPIFPPVAVKSPVVIVPETLALLRIALVAVKIPLVLTEKFSPTDNEPLAKKWTLSLYKPELLIFQAPILPEVALIFPFILAFLAINCPLVSTWN